MKLSRVLLALTLLFPAVPALAQESPGHADRAEEDQVRGALRREAENEFSANDPAEARDTCRELLAHIEATRWRTPGEMEEQRQWAKNCADGTYQPYRGPAPPSHGATYVLIDSGLDKIFDQFLPLLKQLPYDRKNDPNEVARRSLALSVDCWGLTDYAKSYGQGAFGLVKHCEALAYYIHDRTIKPQKEVFFCLQFRRARDAFAEVDVAGSAFRARIETAQRDIEKMLARPECQPKSKR